ncbi:hypothetical protein QYE76_068075 [Lolium multiflorum]|uniref:Uncharacterized protein n=1 Tax=Lolium multiflorum TaxID=4521 RepID=A0AAD8WC95_LOLMU|nr:hypothetical protein QYE76_068075 [Lolium multiflorum]
MEQISTILRDQFGILPKRRTIGYSKPYPNEYDLIPLPPKYRLPEFSKFNGSEGSSSIEHVSRYLAQLGMISASDPLRVRQKRGETVSEYIQRFRTVKNRCYSARLTEKEAVDLAVVGLAAPFKDLTFQVDYNSLAHLVQKLTLYEQRHPELYQDKFKRPIGLVETEDVEDSEDQEIAVAEWARGAVPVSCKWVKPQGPAKGFDFDISKAEQIFDLLLKEKQLKLPEGHKIPTAQEMNGRPYCKWHHSFTHVTNDCKELRRQIQSAIEQGRLILGQFAMKVDTHPFPGVNMVELNHSTRHQPGFSFEVNMAGPVHHHGNDKEEIGHSRGKEKEEAGPRDRPRYDDRRYVTEEQRAESSRGEDLEESEDEEEDRYHRPRWCPDGLSHSQKRRVQRLRNLEEAEAQYLYTLRKARPDLAVKIQQTLETEMRPQKKEWRPKQTKADAKASAGTNMVFILPSEFRAPRTEEVPVAQFDCGPRPVIFEKPRERSYKHLKALYLRVVVQVYDGLEKVVFYLSRRMLDAETRYPEIEKLCLCLFFTCTKLHHILLTAEIVVICKSDVIKHMLSAPVLKGRLGKWMFALSEFDIRYQPAKAVKGQALADLIAERINTDIAALSVRAWAMFFDGSVCDDGCGIGILLVSPRGATYSFSIRLPTPCTNNVAEYEAICKGMELLLEAGAEAVELFGDSKLVISQLTEEYKCESESLFPLWMQCRELMAQFKYINFNWIPRSQNTEANDLAQMASGYKDVADGADVQVRDSPDYHDRWRFGLRFSEFRKFCEDMGIKLIRSSPYYAQANGQAEASNKSLIKLIKRKIDEHPRRWHEVLSEALWAYRMSCHGAIKTSPYHLVYGQEAVLPWEITAGSRRVAFQNDLTTEEYAALMSDSIEDVTELRLWSLEKIKENKAKVARAYNKKVRPKEFHVGDLVWEAVLPLGTKDAAYGKWSPNWHGPYRVDQVLKGNAYMLEELNGVKFPVAVNGQHLKKYFPSMWDDGQ